MVTLACVFNLFGSSHAAHVEPLPLVYSAEYNLGFGSIIDNLFSLIHPFDIRKYEKIYEHLKTRFNLSEHNFYLPQAVTNDDLREVHEQRYLDSLQHSWVISQGIDVGYALAGLSGPLLDKLLLYPLRVATGGTIKAAELALKYGWSINLAGGFHHAKPHQGEGGCFYADVPLAIKRLHDVNPDLKVLIVDLDAHQGNGNAHYAQHDKRIFIFDMYNKNEYPVYDLRIQENPLYDGKQALKHVQFPCALDGGYMGTTAFSKYVGLSIPWFSDWPLIGAIDIPVLRRVDDNEYLSLLSTKLPEALSQLQQQSNKPDLIIYNAGSDIFAEDDLGILNISASGILRRDILVWNLARNNNIPIMMVPSGGYGPKSAQIVAASMEAIVHIELERK
jgi:histone deacetylase 11